MVSGYSYNSNSRALKQTLMKQFFLVIVITILTVFCFAKAQGQVSIFGSNSVNGWSKTPAGIWLSKYATTNTGIFLGFDSQGKGVLRDIDTINSIAKNWTVVNMPHGNRFTGNAFGNGIWMVIGLDDTATQVYTTIDGRIFNAVTNFPANANPYDIIFDENSGDFILACRGAGTARIITTHDNGRTWTVDLDNTDIPLGMQTLTAGDGVIVALGNESDVAAIRINNVWDTVQTGLVGSYRDMTYRDGIFFAVSNLPNYAIRSTDSGYTWSVVTMPDTGSWFGTFINTEGFVAVCGSCSDYRIATSTDAITWTGDSTLNDYEWLYGTYGDKYSVLVAYSSPDSSQVARKYDGNPNWELVENAGDSTNGWHHVKYANGMFMATSVNGKIMTSGYPVFLEPETFPPALTVDSNTYVTVTRLADSMASLTDTTFTNWDTLTPPENNFWIKMAANDKIMVALARSGTNRVMWTEDGWRWNLASGIDANLWSGITWGKDKFVATARSGTWRIAYSYDGKTWINTSLSSALEITSVTYYNGTFVAVTLGTTFYTSPDGITWTARTAPSASYRDVAGGNGAFVAVSNATNYIANSTDNGVTWTTQTPADSGNIQTVINGNGKFLAVCNTCDPYKLMTSTDNGVTWVGDSAYNEYNWILAAYGGGYFIVVADLGTAGRSRIMRSPDASVGSWELLEGQGDSINTSRGIAYMNGFFAIVGNNNRIIRSGRVDEMKTTQPVLDTGFAKNYNPATFSTLTATGISNFGGSTVSATGGLSLANVEQRFGDNTIYFSSTGAGPRVFGGSGDLNWTTVGLFRLRYTTGFSITDNTTTFVTQDASALVQFESTTKGVVIPRMTGAQAEAISTPLESLLIYATDGSGVTITSKGWWGFDGAVWVKLN